MKSLRYFALSIVLLSACGPADPLTLSQSSSLSLAGTQGAQETPAFYKYCTATDNPKDIQHSVDKLKEVVTKPDEGSISCDIALERLSRSSLTIDLANQGISSLLPFAGLKGIGQLLLSGNSITSLKGLEGLDALYRIDLAKNDVVDVSELTKNKSLHMIGIASNPVTSIDALAKMPRLTYIDISATKITDASILADSQLRDLSMSDLPGLRDLEFIGQLKHLESFVAMNSAIKSLYFLTENNASLRFINVSDNEISDIYPLKRLKNLDYVVVSSNTINHVEGILELPKLKHFSAYGNPFSTISVGTVPPNHPLESITLWDNKNLEDLRFIRKFPNLKQLRLSGAGIKHIPDLSQHSKLRVITAGWCPLTQESIANIMAVKQLHTLSLGKTNLESFDLKESRPALVKLTISYNPKIRSLDFLKHTPNIEYLIAHGNTIETFPEGVGQKLTYLSVAVDNSKENVARAFNLPELKHLYLKTKGEGAMTIELAEKKEKLKELALSGQPLTDTSFLKSLPNLEKLEAFGVSLRDLSDIVSLPLTHLDVRYNCLSSIKPLADATHIWSTLKQLNLEDNQIMDLDLLPADKTAKLEMFKVEDNGKKKERCSEDAIGAL